MGGLHHSNYTESLGGAGGGVVRKIGRNSCELCRAQARVYCAADEARLCLVCDYKVHSANFLVSKHSRDVLCASCGALTLSSALTGPRIDHHQTRHCTQCAPITGDDDDDVSSTESRNSSCCTDQSNDGVSHALKRRAFIFLEEGCGDSEEPFPPKRRITTSHRHTQPFLESV